jgi:hypothetical protein
MKRFFVAVTVALAALAVAAPASATTVIITISCDQVTFNYSSFPTTIESTSVETVTVDGEPFYTDTVEFTETRVTVVPLSIDGTAFVEASAAWTAFQSDTEFAEAQVSCGGGTTDGTTEGTDGTTEGTTDGTTEGTDGTTEGTTEGTDGTTEGTTNGTDNTGGVDVATTGGTEPGGELPFTGLPVWVPILLAAALLATGGFLLRRRRDLS